MPVTVQDLLKGRLALVTGAGTGIGAALARGLAAHGAAVVVAGRADTALAGTLEAITAAGGRAWARAVDVARPDSCRELALWVGGEAGEVSILVNNAGVIHYAGMEDLAVEEAWRSTLDVNLSGPFNVVRAFLAPLKATRGAVVNIASIAAFIYTGNTVGYSASKGGLRMLTVALARELGPHGVRVNAVAPGAIATPMSPSAGDPERLAALQRRVPLGRIGQPEDMVGPVVFLASPMAAYVTGTTLVADGGYLTN
ncbi:MAG TPA: SDR family oxidoreductase [Crenalkalicoccus sp.]|nr:SDR family oxidoreductase [Crenalkalicoccus sp.]